MDCFYNPILINGKLYMIKNKLKRKPFIINITDIFNKTSTTHYKKCYNVNIFPAYSFIRDGEYTEIATTIILAIDKKSILHIYFENYQYFNDNYTTRSIFFHLPKMHGFRQTQFLIIKILSILLIIKYNSNYYIFYHILFIT